MIRISIQLHPPAHVAEHARAIRDVLWAHSLLLPRTDGKEYQPHLTLYAPGFPEHNEAKVIEVLEKFRSTVPPLRFVDARIISYKRGYIATMFVYSPEIRAFLSELLGAINPLREGAILAHYLPGGRGYDALTQQEHRNVELYGHPDPIDSFTPHISFGKLKHDADEAPARELISWQIPEFVASDLAWTVVRA